MKSEIQATNKPHIFSSDRPIKQLSDDLLGRERFSKKLSKSILNWKEDESLVIGLYGKWGDGKTSVKNLLLENFLEKEASKIEVLDFNPWEWSNSQDLIKIFMRSLSTIILKSDNKNSKKIMRCLSKYVTHLHEGDFQNYLSILIDILGLAPIRWICYPFRFICNLLGLHFEISIKKTLEKRKSEIRDLMRKNETTFLVVIDDIDRLPPKEIKDIFRLIKINMDFPKFVFLTLFQRDIVEKSLSFNGSISGNEYLEKIIQVGIDLPTVSQEQINKVLFEKLEKLIEKYNGSEHFDTSRWNELFMNGVSIYFNNLRNVHRLISSLRFHMGNLINNNVLEVNFLDFFVIETLRSFEPEVYHALFTNKHILIRSRQSQSLTSNDQENNIEHILEKSKNANKDKIKFILETLFPNVCSPNRLKLISEDEAFNELRICHEDRFDRYFSLFMAQEDFYQYEFEEALEATKNKSDLLKIFSRLKDNDRLNSFLNKFAPYSQRIPEKNASQFLSAMFDLGDLVDNEYNEIFYFNSFMAIKQMFEQCSKNIKSTEDRRKIFMEAIDNSEGIAFPVIILYDEYKGERRSSYPDYYNLDSEDEEWAKKKILERIDSNKEKERFRSICNLFLIIDIWINLEEKESKLWLSNFLIDDRNFLASLNKLIYINKRHGSVGVQRIPHIIIQGWMVSFFPDVDATIERFENLNKKNLIDTNKYPNLIEAMKRVKLTHSDPRKYSDPYSGELPEVKK